MVRLELKQSYKYLQDVLAYVDELYDGVIENRIVNPFNTGDDTELQPAPFGPYYPTMQYNKKCKSLNRLIVHTLPSYGEYCVKYKEEDIKVTISEKEVQNQVVEKIELFLEGSSNEILTDFIFDAVKFEYDRKNRSNTVTVISKELNPTMGMMQDKEQTVNKVLFDRLSQPPSLTLTLKTDIINYISYEDKSWFDDHNLIHNRHYVFIGNSNSNCNQSVMERPQGYPSLVSYRSTPLSAEMISMIRAIASEFNLKIYQDMNADKCDENQILVMTSMHKPSNYKGIVIYCFPNRENYENSTINPVTVDVEVQFNYMSKETIKATFSEFFGEVHEQIDENIFEELSKCEISPNEFRESFRNSRSIDCNQFATSLLATFKQLHEIKNKTKVSVANPGPRIIREMVAVHPNSGSYGGFDQDDGYGGY